MVSSRLTSVTGGDLSGSGSEISGADFLILITEFISITNQASAKFTSIALKIVTLQVNWFLISSTYFIFQVISISETETTSLTTAKVLKFDITFKTN